jgi:hypothetical protein
MAHDVYYQFFQTPEQALRVGARGGRATARHRRERLDGAAAVPREAAPGGPPRGPRETTAAAIALLDAQYPWLRGVEKRFSNRSIRLACDAVLQSHLN